MTERVEFRPHPFAPWGKCFTPLAVEERAIVNRVIGWEMYRSVD